jgi:WD40 repeat protein
VATASIDCTARIWDAMTGRPLGEPMRHDDKVQSARFSRDGKRLLTFTDYAVCLWELTWHAIDNIDALVKGISGTVPKDATLVTPGDLRVAWPLSKEDIGKSVFD